MAPPANPPVSLPAGVNSAIALHNAGKAADAVDQLSAWLSEHADCAEGWFWKGVMLSDMASISVGVAWKGEHGHDIRKFHETIAMDALACFDEIMQIEPGHFETLLAKAAILARIARATDAGSKVLLAVAEKQMRDEEASTRYVQPHVARYICFLNRAMELLDQATVIRPDDERIAALTTSLREEYPDMLVREYERESEE